MPNVASPMPHMTARECSPLKPCSAGFLQEEKTRDSSAKGEEYRRVRHASVRHSLSQPKRHVHVIHDDRRMEIT